MAKIKILVADDTPIAREGMKNLLNRDAEFELTPMPTLAAEVREFAMQHRPDVLVLDLDWFADNGSNMLSEIPQLKTLLPKMKIITMTGIRELIPKAKAAGADESISKGFSHEEISRIIRAVNRRENVSVAPRPAFTANELTTREKDVLTLISQGLLDKEIGPRLDISHHTAKHYVRAIIEKLGAKNRAHAIAIGLEKGYITR